MTYSIISYTKWIHYNMKPFKSFIALQEKREKQIKGGIKLETFVREGKFPGTYLSSLTSLKAVMQAQGKM